MRIGEAESIRQVVEGAMASSQIPGIVLVAARGGQPAEYMSVGVDAGGNALTRDSLFPVASVSKLAVALAVLRLVDRGALGLDDLLVHFLGDAAAAGPGVTVRTLLCHTSGLPGDLPEGLGLPPWPALAHACVETAPAALPGARLEYSNVGYGILAVLVERITGQRFGEALHDLVLDPLGIEGYLDAEPPRAPVGLTGTRGTHLGTDLEAYNGTRWRAAGLPWAGLITTAEGALALVNAFAGVPDNFLDSSTRTEATRNQAGDLGCDLFGLIPWRTCHWGLGPELRDAKQPHWAPSTASPGSFGHAGQSGCVAWYDPAKDVAWTILGTRTADSGWLLRRCPAIGAAILAWE
ncbi:MAG TPA: serine hydrolase domain-containing protein [Herpetosiphonaceae bacterium]|nr:serine hydrolase domain-containing protein [Herpetosiphonaceae bacterium]